MKKVNLIVCSLLSGLIFPAQKSIAQANDTTLLFPALVKINLVLEGNPFAQYIALKEMEVRYARSVFKDIYQEQLKLFEEFLGFPHAGAAAMQLKTLKQNYGDSKVPPGSQYRLYPAIDIIKEYSDRHRIIIWGEEHHLPQTRALYAEMIRELWKKGFRYLAAESFTEEVERKEMKHVNYRCGIYTRDPVFAEAVNLAIQLGFRLVSYDNKEKERDRVQAEIINKKVFSRDPNAKILILAGRSHSVEEKTADGWEPMGYWLKKITGLDPFTLYAPTMSERLTREEEHPVYKFVTENMDLHQISILKDSTGKLYGNSIYNDAYVFFPRVNLNNYRPTWIFSELKRKPVSIPRSLLKKKEEVLIQAFTKDQPTSAIPVDQVVVYGKNSKIKLALPKGEYNIRAIYSDETISELLKIKAK